MEEVLGVTCDVCRSGIKYPICFQLNPCQHRACVRCFHQFLPVGVFHRCPCKDCHEWIASSTLLELKGMIETKSSPRTPSTKRNPQNAGATTFLQDGRTQRQEDPSYLRQIQEVPHFQPDEQMDPFRHWAIHKPSLYTGLIYVAYRSSQDQATFYKSGFKAYDSTVFMDNDSSDELVKIFARILHPLLFQESRRDKNSASKSKAGEPSPPSSSSPSPPPPRLLDPIFHHDKKDDRHAADTRLDDHYYDRKDRQHLAMRCMYALTSGRVLTRAEQEETFWGKTRKNPKQSNRDKDVPVAVLANNTRQLALELLKAYQASLCMAQNGGDEIASSAKKQSSPPPPTTTTPMTIIHDLRPRQKEISKHDAPKEIPSTTTCEGPHDWIVSPNDTSDDEETNHVATNLSITDSSSERAWADELGQYSFDDNKEENENLIHNNDKDIPSGVIPTILWILGAVFALSVQVVVRRGKIYYCTNVLAQTNKQTNKKHHPSGAD